MKRIPLALAILITITILAGCGPQGSSFRIKGKFRDMEAGELYIYNLSTNRERLDTLTVHNGTFLYKGQVDGITPFILVFPNGMEQIIFANKGQELLYEATANDLRNYVVNGSDENKLMNQFRKDTYAMSPEQTLTTARQYIKDHADSPVALYLFLHYFAYSDLASAAETSQLLTLLRKAQPDAPQLIALHHRLRSTALHRAGAKVPNLTLTRRNRTTDKLWSVATTPYTVLAYWATWKQNGYDIPWRLRQIGDEHREAGDLSIVGISLDVEHYRWEDATRIDTASTLVRHYCDGLSFQSSAATSLGITQAPFFILADKHHKILSTSTTIDELKSDIKNYVK